jgi:hypothetical protein
LLQRAVLGVAAEQRVECQLAREQHRQPQHRRRDLRQHLGLAAEREREQHDDQQCEQCRLQRIAATTPEQPQVTGHQGLGGGPDHASASTLLPLPRRSSTSIRVRTGGAA